MTRRIISYRMRRQTYLLGFFNQNLDDYCSISFFRCMHNTCLPTSLGPPRYIHRQHTLITHTLIQLVHNPQVRGSSAPRPDWPICPPLSDRQWRRRRDRCGCICTDAELCVVSCCAALWPVLCLHAKVDVGTQGMSAPCIQHAYACLFSNHHRVLSVGRPPAELDGLCFNFFSWVLGFMVDSMIRRFLTFFFLPFPRRNLNGLAPSIHIHTYLYTLVTMHAYPNRSDRCSWLDMATYLGWVDK